MKDLRDVDYEQYVRKEIPGYIEVDDELTHIRTTLSASENIIQYGPQGIGKTLSYEHVAAKERVPIIQLDCSKDTKRSHLVAQTTFSIDKDGNKKVEFIPGAIPKSIIAANQYGKAMLILEEINALSPALQKMLNQISDHRQAIEVSEAGGMVRLNKDSNLMVGGTMNPSGTFGGTFDLNRDLRSRFNELQREFPNNRKLREILKVQNVPEKVGDQSNVIPQISSFVESVHSLVEKGKVSYEFSPRDAVRLGKMWDQYYEVLLEVNDKGMNESRESLRMALQTSVMGKFREEEEKQLIGEQISDCFAVQSY